MEHLEKLIIDLKESLEREMRQGFADLRVRFDNQATRLDRQGGLLQTGNRWIARTNDWTEKVDQALATKDREIAELRMRLEKLEKRNGNSGPIQPPN